jgi:hypothetical protein
LDEQGAPVALPENRIVPPEMAPAGLAVRMLDVPQTRVPLVESPEEARARDATR